MPNGEFTENLLETPQDLLFWIRPHLRSMSVEKAGLGKLNMSQCLSLCKNYGMVATALVEGSKESDEIGSAVNKIMDEYGCCDVSVTFRVNDPDQTVKCPQKTLLGSSYDDCLF